MNRFHLCILAFILCYINLACNNGYAQPIWSWGNNFGGIKDEYPVSVKTDNNGNIFIAGIFESPVLTIGTNTLNLDPTSKKDIFLVKLNSSGTVLWARRAGSYHQNIYSYCNYDFNYVNCMVVDNSGNCYIAGMFESDTIVFSPSIMLYKKCKAGDADLFIAKYDANGNVLWAKKFGGTVWDKANDICIDNTGNIIITGTFWSPNIYFDSFLLTSSASPNAFVAKINSNGNVLWANCITGSGGKDATCVSVDNNNSIIVGGNFLNMPINISPLLLYNTGMWDVFISKYDQNGNVLWSRSAIGDGTDAIYALRTDNTGNIYITGRFTSKTLSFGSLPPLNNNSSNGCYDLYIAKYNSSGNELLAKDFGGYGKDDVLSMTIDISGNILISGLYGSDSIQFDSYVLQKTGARNVFISKLSPNLNVIWALTSTGNNKDYVNHLASDNSGNYYIFGSFSGNFSLGLYNFYGSGLADFYLIKFY